MGDVWVDVPGYFNKVTSHGGVASCRRLVLRGNGSPHTVKGQTLSPWRTSSGHLMVRAYRHDGTREDIGVHRLIALAFLGPCPDGMECRHLNDVPDDNRVENLCWGTRKEQAEDRKRNNNSHYDTSPKGERQWCAKLKEAAVREIREMYATGEWTMQKLADMHGVTLPTLACVIYRKTWKHVT